MPFSQSDVPPGPYFHGTRRLLSPGASLHADSVDPSAGDDREMVWATTDVDAALDWAKRRYPLSGDTLYVYEVELTDPEIDTNHHREGEAGVVNSVMAPAGVVTRLVKSVAAQARTRSANKGLCVERQRLG